MARRGGEETDLVLCVQAHVRRVEQVSTIDGLLLKTVMDTRFSAWKWPRASRQGASGVTGFIRGGETTKMNKMDSHAHPRGGAGASPRIKWIKWINRINSILFILFGNKNEYDEPTELIPFYSFYSFKFLFID